MKYDIFVSYRRSDRELVASIVRRLEARGVAIWYDAEIEGGADWREVIVEALTNSDMLVIFFSDDANNSRQLKKELAIADTLGKAVVPILIEDTRPRGAYLYELADRNWIQAFPDPVEKIDELVEHLATLAGKDGLRRGAAPAAKVAAANDAGPTGAGPAVVAAAPAPAPAAPAPVREAEQPLVVAVEEFIEGAQESKAPPPKMAKAYVGHVGADGKPVRKLNDILPFKWIDLVFLVPLLIAGAIFLNAVVIDADSMESEDLIGTALVAIAAIAAYGAAVFPVRYYLRRRPPLRALGSYLVSSAILYALFAAGYLVVRYGTDIFEYDDTTEVLVMFGVIWLAFMIIAFLIYGLLAVQRAIRSFRSNIRKI